METNLKKHIDKDRILSNPAKEKLCKLYNSIKIKNIKEQAFEMLELHDVVKKSACDYRYTIIHLLKNCDTANDKDLADDLERIFLFFDILCCDDFEQLMAIESALYWGSDDKREEKIDELFKSRNLK